MVDRTEQRDGSVVFADERGAARVSVLASGVVLAALVGKGSADVDRAVIGELTLEIRRAGRLVVYCDLRDLSRLAMETRDQASEWGRDNKGNFEVNCLVNSKLVEMAASVISMMMGISFGMYSSEQKFVAAIQQKVPAFRRLPELPVVETQRAGGER